MEALKLECERVKQDNEGLLAQRSLFSKRIETANSGMSQVVVEKEKLNARLQELLEKATKAEETKLEDSELRERLRKAEEGLAKYRQQAESLDAQCTKVNAQIKKTKSDRS